MIFLLFLIHFLTSFPIILPLEHFAWTICPFAVPWTQQECSCLKTIIRATPDQSIDLFIYLSSTPPTFFLSIHLSPLPFSIYQSFDSLTSFSSIVKYHMRQGILDNPIWNKKLYLKKTTTVLLPKLYSLISFPPWFFSIEITTTCCIYC